jgi:four helix bundle protein
MTDRDPHVSLVRPESCDPPEQMQLPHENLDVYDVLEEAYRIAMSWKGVSWAKGTTGDQLKRASESAVLRYTEGYYADGGHKTSHWKAARASCGEAAAAAQLLAIDGKVAAEDARRVRALWSRAMRMLARLLHPR